MATPNSGDIATVVTRGKKIFNNLPTPIFVTNVKIKYSILWNFAIKRIIFSIFIIVAKQETSTLGISAAIDLIGFGRFQLLLSLAVGFAFVADAMEMMILSILGPALRCTDWRISKYDQALLTTVVFLGKLLQWNVVFIYLLVLIVLWN